MPYRETQVAFLSTRVFGAPRATFIPACTECRTGLFFFLNNYNFQTALLGPLPSSFGELSVLEKALFCSNVFNGIHMKLSVKLSNSLSV